MKTTELITQAYILCTPLLKVDSIQFRTSISFEDGIDNRLELTVFFRNPEGRTNFTVYSYSSRRNYGIMDLLNELKIELLKYDKIDKSDDLNSIDICTDSSII